MATFGYLRRLYNPPIFQGPKKVKNYFEGWYFKLVDPEGEHIWSVIPGISYSNDPHCFIQVIHANSGRSYYKRFPLADFSYAPSTFRIQIGANTFSDEQMELDFHAEDLVMKGRLAFKNSHRYPVTFLAPGIMGWYAYVPFMECYHGVVSMDHGLSGRLEINGSLVSFEGGKGYIEKDWGRSMPSDWIWVQSNHFSFDQKASFMLSYARIPWLKGYFPGFLSFFLLDDRIYNFATYNRSRVDYLSVGEEQVDIRLSNRKFRLELSVQRKDGGILKAPRHGMMERDIKESVISRLDLVLKNHRGEILFSGKGKFAGLEIVGDMEQYM